MDLLKKALELPEKPGVYIMHNAEGRIIYVGKAKILKNRVVSYFRNGEHTPKTERLVKEVEDFDVIICESELDALLTECSLIRHHAPFYNIKLKDSTGSGYPFIHLYKEKIGSINAPMLEMSFNKTNNGKFFGPFVSRFNAKNLITLLAKTFKLPQCGKNSARTDKGCMERQIDRCAGWCVGSISQEESDKIYNDIISVMSGNADELYEKVKADMEAAAEELEFEKAAVLRDRLRSLNLLTEKQRPMVSQKRNADYIACGETEGHCAIFMLRIRNGYVIGENCNIFSEKMTSDLLREYIERFYTEETQLPTKIYLETEHEWLPLINEWLGGIVSTASFDSDRTLLAVSRKNADERLLQYEGRTKKGQRLQRLFNQFIGIDNVRRLEIYDISHIAGEEIVCGIAVSNDGIFDKKSYKRLKIGKIEGYDDTAYMYEAIYRRLQRFVSGDAKFAPLPDIIVCDGGRGQINAALRAISDCGLSVPVIGFKKDSKHKTKAISFQNPDIPDKPLSISPEVFAFCGRLQEEVHRYAIEYHRNLRDKLTQQSRLQQIDGIGKTKAKDLFLKFKSVDKIAAASTEDLCKVKGIAPTLAQRILEELNSEE
ncbi:MAG: excinuclease ABC subunit UvrC [Clostridia bacterium]|nr:excinuclease ABC subunit UvrC [Clostridia bacterium]